jgi:hypothetical protein
VIQADLMELSAQLRVCLPGTCSSSHGVTIPATRFDAVNIVKQMTLYLRFDDTASFIRAQPP